jgi:hypothetical protein
MLWTKMVEKHAVALDAEIDGLSEQLEEVSSRKKNMSPLLLQQQKVATPAEFRQTTGALLQTMQSIHREVGQLFASSISPSGPDDAATLVEHLRTSMPQAQAQALVRFSQKMRQ